MGARHLALTGPRSRRETRRSARSRPALLHPPAGSGRPEVRRRAVGLTCFPGGRPPAQQTSAPC
eukprot:9470099-Pyramimonas_sp.AAC.1